MKIITNILQQLSHGPSSLQEKKSRKLAETDRYLFAHRQGYRATRPIGFKSRSEGSYYLTAHSRH